MRLILRGRSGVYPGPCISTDTSSGAASSSRGSAIRGFAFITGGESPRVVIKSDTTHEPQSNRP